MTRRRRNITIVLYTRSQCTLCTQAATRIDLEARGCTVVTVDIDTDDALLKRYGMRIPVVSVDGREIAEGAVQPGVISAAVRAARTDAGRSRVSRWRFWA